RQPPDSAGPVQRSDGPPRVILTVETVTPTSAPGAAASYRDFYRGRRVLITGGLGFIGSNLAHALVALGAEVLIVDSLIPEYGGNLFNVRAIEDRVRVNIADVRQQTTMNYLVQGQDVIFNLAGQVSH